jgi:DNA-binding CsgD family transcriptional regulator/tetratricopeptide (TPR) repeat protein
VVDDLHWADAASRLALLTVARRLEEDRVVLIVTSRPDSATSDGWDRFRLDDRCCVVSLGALTPQDVADMAECNGVALTPEGALRLHRHTGGHPLYVRTLLNEMTPEQLATTGAELPAPRSLAFATVGRLAELPAASRHLAAAMAVVNSRAPLSLVGRIAGVSQPTLALEALLATGFVSGSMNEPGKPVEYSHPLYRTAVYEDLPATRRQQLHLAAAGVVSAELALEHRIAATDGIDEVLAAEVAHAAVRFAAAGAPHQAATYLLVSSALTGSLERSEGWLIEAARLFLRHQQTGRVAAVADRIKSCQEVPARNLVLGTLAWQQGQAEQAIDWLGRAGQADGPNDVKAEALAQLGQVYASEMRGEEAVAAAEAALRLQPRDPVTEQTAWTALTLGRGCIDGAPAGIEVMNQRLPDPAHATPADAELLIIRGTLDLYATRYHAAIDDLSAAVRLLHSGDMAAHFARAHVHLCQSLFETGDWDAALVHARTALSLTAGERTTWVEAQAHAATDIVLVSRGEWDTAAPHLARGRELADEAGTAEATLTVMGTEAGLARAQGNPAAVVQALRGADDLSLIPMISRLSWLPTLITAYLDLGEVERAAHTLDALEAGATARRLDRQAVIQGLRAGVARLNKQSGEAATGYQDAIDRFGPDDPLLDRARAHHDYGRLLRDLGKHKPAVAQLRLAHELLSGVGAEPFRQRVAADLAAVGIRSGPQGKPRPLDLTAREHDVAALVGRGLTNREVATELYVSEKTVEYHLRSVFGKLGIDSRRQLRNFTTASVN